MSQERSDTLVLFGATGYTGRLVADALVEEGYLRKIPEDPITKSSETWQTVQAEEETSDDPDAAAGGVMDVKSGADGAALDGSRHGDW